MQPDLPPDLCAQVTTALREDVGSGDLTAALIPADRQATATVISREPAILCGRPWFDETFRQLDPNVRVTWAVEEGQRIAPNEVLCTLQGPALTAARSLAAVATISLMVGGIGIMNIMLAGVAQRRREIGVRVAVGTRHRDILSQFLAEAMMLSLLGGSFGIALGCVASWSVARLYDWPTSITTSAISIGFLCSLTVGVFFGYYPARQAAILVPTEALRAEA